MIHNPFAAILRGALIAFIIGAVVGLVFGYYMGYDIGYERAVEAIRQLKDLGGSN